MKRVHLPITLLPEAEFLRGGPRSFRLLNRRTGTHVSLEAPERFLVELLGKHDTVSSIATVYEAKFGIPLSEGTIWEFVGQLQRLALLDDRRIDNSQANAQVDVPNTKHSLNGSAASNGATSHVPFGFDKTGTAANSSASSHPTDDDESVPIAPLEVHPTKTACVNTVFDLLVMMFGWILHPICLLPAVPIMIVAACILVRHWDQLGYESTIFWVRYPFFELFLASYIQTQFLMNLPLAIMTGMCCRANRGRIRTFGITYGKWVLPTASFSIDIGDAFPLMDNKGRRKHLAVRLLTPLVLGSMYVVAWKTGSRASNLHLFWLCMVMTSLILFVYQMNPFSSYSSAHAALSWYLDDWKLHERAMNETWAWFCGSRSPEPLGWQERIRLRTYGVMAFLLRFATDVTLLVMSTYYLTKWFGAVGFASLLFLMGWWNRDHLRPLWNWSGSSPQDLRRQLESLVCRKGNFVRPSTRLAGPTQTHRKSLT